MIKTSVMGLDTGDGLSQQPPLPNKGAEMASDLFCRDSKPTTDPQIKTALYY